MSKNCTLCSKSFKNLNLHNTKKHARFELVASDVIITEDICKNGQDISVDIPKFYSLRKNNVCMGISFMFDNSEWMSDSTIHNATCVLEYFDERCRMSMWIYADNTFEVKKNHKEVGYGSVIVRRQPITKTN